MENIIYEELLGPIKFHFGRGKTDMDMFLIHSLAVDILDKIEELGMLPPTSKLSKLDTFDNSWEPEDNE